MFPTMSSFHIYQYNIIRAYLRFREIFSCAQGCDFISRVSERVERA